MVYDIIGRKEITDPDGLPCECGSSDGRKLDPKKNGWSHCFVCNKNFREEGLFKEGNLSEREAAPARPTTPPEPVADEFVGLPDRGISQVTAERYRVARYPEGDWFPSFKDNQIVGNKLRRGDKTFKWTGTQGELFGQNLFPAGSAKYVTVTEGEYDALAAYEMLGSRWPVVSVLNGTGTAVNDVRNNFEYLNSFDTIVLNFDHDEAGCKAAKACASLGFPPGKVKITNGDLKDANEYLLAKRAKDYQKVFWDAKPFLLDGLILGPQMWDSIINRPNHFATPYPFEGLNKFTYGIRLSELVVVTAETGRGKTSLLKEIEHKLLTDKEIIEKGYGVGFLHLEEPNYDTALGLMSIESSKPYHLPDTPRTEVELRGAYDAVVNNDRVVIWDHFGSNSVDEVLKKVRHMSALGCKYVVVDHLSIIVSDQSGDERKQLDEISTKLKTLCMELNIALIAVIHQNRQGQIRGTAGVEQLANIVMKCHREVTDVDPWRRNVLKIVIEKNRFSGRAGPACWLWYNEHTGRLVELSQEDIDKYESGDTKRDDEYEF